MILNDKWAFVHIPKTGGTSITEALGGRTEEWGLHCTLRMLDNPPPQSFCFVRDPANWVLSNYLYNCHKDPVDQEEQDYQERIRKLGFKGWMMEGQFFLRDDPPGVPPMQARDQSYWWQDCSHVGRFENLEPDLDRICKAVGIKRGPLRHLNRSAYVNPRPFYDSELRNMVELYHHKTLELYEKAGA